MPICIGILQVEMEGVEEIEEEINAALVHTTDAQRDGSGREVVDKILEEAVADIEETFKEQNGELHYQEGIIYYS